MYAYSIPLVAVDTTQAENENIIGVLVAWRLADSLEIATISVAKAYRHLGIARSLLAQAICISEDHGIYRSDFGSPRK